MEPNVEPKYVPAKIKFVYLKDLSLMMSILTKEMADNENLNENLEIELTGSNYILIEKSWALLNLDVKIHFKSNDEKPTLLLHYNCEVAFEVENFQEIFFPFQEGLYIANSRTTHSLMSISLSTIRGILIEKTSNSSLKHVPLPIVNPGALEMGTLYNVL